MGAWRGWAALPRTRCRFSARRGGTTDASTPGPTCRTSVFSTRSPVRRSARLSRRSPPGRRRRGRSLPSTSPITRRRRAMPILRASMRSARPFSRHGRWSLSRRRAACCRRPLRSRASLTMPRRWPPAIPSASRRSGWRDGSSRSSCRRVPSTATSCCVRRSGALPGVMAPFSAPGRGCCSTRRRCARPRGCTGSSGRCSPSATRRSTGCSRRRATPTTSPARAGCAS